MDPLIATDFSVAPYTSPRTGMALTRRAFLERMGWAIATLGLSQSSFFALGDRYHQALAAPSHRQRALLIGINQYPESVCDFPPIKGSALAGCITDVEMQRELLIHRFGFQPAEILLLTDEAATRQGIEDALQAHLLAAAQGGDRLLFHFSGLGSQVRSLDSNLTLKTLVPVDGALPTADHPSFNDIQFATLQALLRALPTQQLTTVIDASFRERGTPLQGNFRVRSRPSSPSGHLNSAEQALQAQLSSKTPRGNDQEFPGLYLVAAAAGQPALEGQWSGFSAGLLTYTLTQYLWEITPPKTIQTIFSRLARRLYQSVDGLQKPVLTQSQPTESVYTQASTLPPSQGVVWGTGTDGTVQLWLGGVLPDLLECYGNNSVFQAGTGGSQVSLVGRSRTGLLLKADVTGSPAVAVDTLVGQPVQEVIRLIPRNLGLTIALDPALERIERVDATSAFAAAKVNVVAVGEQAADLLFGKATTTTLTASSDVAAPPPVLKSYGLFYPPRVAVPGTLASADEAVKAAVTRLVAKLPRLLAIKYLTLSENPTTSGIPLRISLETTDISPQRIAQTQTTASATVAPFPPLTGDSPPVSAGTSLQGRIQNLSGEPLYVLRITLSQVNHPLLVEFSAEDMPDLPSGAIAPGATQTFPLVALGHGPVEIFIIASRRPFPQTMALLQKQQAADGNATSVQTSLSRVQAILQDLSGENSPADAYALDVSQWATLRLRYQIT